MCQPEATESEADRADCILGDDRHFVTPVAPFGTVFAVGRSILNRAPVPHIGNLCLTYGGGGHANAGTCQVANDQAERIQAELIEKLTGQLTP